MNLHDLLRIPVRETPDAVALRFEGSAWTYRDLFAEVERRAAGLLARGVAPGDRVAFYLGNRPELVVAYLALLRIGAVLVPMNLAYRRREIAHVLGDAGPVLLVTDLEHAGVLDELEDGERTSLQEIVAAEDLGSLDGDRTALESIRPDGDDLGLLLYTSGTTGRSKGARISHRNVLATVTDLLAAWAWRPSDELLLTLPMFHTHGLIVGLTTALAAGATVRLHRRFDAARVLDDLASGEPTLFFGVPTLYVRLVRELEERGDPVDLSSMRLFCSGSAPLAPETFEAFRELTGHEILERYGMTEAGMILSNPYAGKRRPGTVGTPLPGVSIRIVDGDGVQVADGEEGEILARGGNVFDGYWRAPEKTAETFHVASEGIRWLKTGDLARRNPETGAVSLLGRRTELILSGGYNVYPREIEEVLETYPGVTEAAVAGRPHPEWGEVPVGFLVIGDGREVDDGELVAYLKERLAGFKVPRTFHRLETLPRNALGKVQKHRLPG